LNILANRTEILNRMTESLRGELSEYGVFLNHLFIKDIIPPPKILQKFIDRISTKMDIESKLMQLEDSLDKITQNNKISKDKDMSNDVDAKYHRMQILSRMSTAIECIELLSNHLRTPERIEAAKLIMNSNFLYHAKTIDYSEVTESITSLKTLIHQLHDGVKDCLVNEPFIVDSVDDFGENTVSDEQQSETEENNVDSNTKESK
jgi:hypothetical protein